MPRPVLNVSYRPEELGESVDMGTVIGAYCCLSRIGRQYRTAYRSALAVILFGSSMGLALAAASTGEDTPAVIAMPMPETDQLVSIRNVQPGRESVALSALLTESSVMPLNDVRWTVKTADGEILIEAKTGEVQAELPPGEYSVTAVFGFKSITEPLTLPEGSRLNVSYVLNAGVLRVLPRVGNVGFAGLASVSRIYNLDGDVRGELVTASKRPGEILNLPSGNYRIESRFEQGNALAVVDVKVKPGIQTAVDVDHVAAIVAMRTLEDAKTSVWSITAKDGSFSSEFSGAHPTLALQPGSYAAILTTPTQRHESVFTIADGESREIFLGE